MHKIINIIAGISLLAFSAGAQNTYTVNGKFTDLKAERKVLFTYMLMGKQHADSTITKNGRFSFKGEIGDDAFPANLSLLPLKVDSSVTAIERLLKIDKKLFFLSKGITLVNGRDAVKKAKIMGGKTQSELIELEAFVKPEADELDRLEGEVIEMLIQTQGKRADTVPRFKARIKTLPLQMASAYQSLNKKRGVFLKKHPDSYVSIDLLRLMKDGGMIDNKAFDSLFNGLSVRLRSTATGKMMAEKLEIERKTAVGITAIDFSLPDVNGKQISLSSYRGKYVLVDFWASWCGPCRAENPSVVKAFNQFKDKNFTVLGVSLDRPGKKDDWLKAIKDDGLAWTHVSDLQFWDNAAAKMYGVRGIPANFLIDPNGVIIAVGLFGDNLTKKLQEITK